MEKFLVISILILTFYSGYKFGRRVEKWAKNHKKK